MLLKLLLFLIPVMVFSNEVIWDSKQEAVLNQAEYDEAVRLYVDKKYPEKVKAYRAAEINKYTVSLNGLMWQDNKETETLKMNWEDAKKYCTHLSLFAISDWRLPSREELESIIDKARRPSIKKEFKFISSSYYWSSTSSVYNSNYAWGVLFYGGSSFNDGKNNNYYVRCVRGGQ